MERGESRERSHSDKDSPRGPERHSAPPPSSGLFDRFFFLHGGDPFSGVPNKHETTRRTRLGLTAGEAMDSPPVDGG